MAIIRIKLIKIKERHIW